MKIAILTQPLERNYGGIMQAYALQKVLRDQGHDVVTIDRQELKKNKIRSLIGLVKYLVLRGLGKSPPLRMTPRVRKKIYTENYKFINSHIFLSEKILSSAALSEYFKKNDFDAVVVGSDQTWRPKYSPDIYDYYLGFCRDNGGIVKIAYASSFGVDSWEYTEEQTRKCRDLIRLFDTVTVRERSGVELCQIHLDTAASCVLDPTLLLGKDDYQKLWSTEKDLTIKTDINAIFAYILDENEYKGQVVTSVSGHFGCEVNRCQPNKPLTNGYKGDVLQHSYPSPTTWVESFSQCSFVITDSFHGCVFSIIFNKPFLAIANKDRGLARFISLLESVGLEDRLVNQGDMSYKNIIEKPIDWSAVNAKLEMTKQESKRILFGGLSKTQNLPADQTFKE